MSKYKIALFDVDGVLMIQPKLFSEIYSERYGIDLNHLVKFYSSNEFRNASIGKYDLKKAILDHNEKWNWTGDIDHLLADWFEAERFPNHELLKLIDELRTKNIKVYIVTQQEKYRSAFLKNDVFKGKYDGFFASCDLGLHKDTMEYWQEVLKLLNISKPSDVIYFDDRPSLVKLASSLGIHGFTYTSPLDVKSRLIPK